MLDRNEGRIRLTEDFKLQARVPVALTFMTPRVPSQGAQGTVVFSLVDKSGKDVSLKFDPSLAAATFEKIELKDADLRRIWGENLYRVLLTSVEPTSGGTWKIEII
jgi:hypothetical protein